MLFALICRDKEGAQDLRLNTREAHLAYLSESGPVIKLGGPLIDDSGERMIGSLLIIDVADGKTAREWAENDPYRKAGLFESVDVMPWRATVGVSLDQ